MKKEKKPTLLSLSQEIEKIVSVMVTKEDLDKKIEPLTIAILNLERRVTKIEETMATKADIARILDHIDAFAHKMETYDRKAVIHDYRMNQHEDPLKIYGTRISQLEAHA